MIKLNELKKDKLKAIFRNDQIVGAISEDSDVSYFNDKELYIKEIDSFEFYYNGNYDDNPDSSEVTIVNMIVNNEYKEFVFKNTVGFALCLLYLHYKEQNEEFEFVTIKNYLYTYNERLREFYDRKPNDLIMKLFDVLNYDNISIISHMISYIYDCGFDTEDELKENEYLSTHYTCDNETHEFTVEQLNKDFDITVYDCLSILGMRNFSEIKNIKSKCTERKEKIKWICIHHFFAHYTIPYTYTFYKILLEDEITDPSDFLE